MAGSLAGVRLIYLGPRDGAGGVGDYAQQFLDAVRPLFGAVVEYRHGGPGEDGVADLRRHRRAVGTLIDEPYPGPTLVHAELSGGAVTPFWAIAGRRDVALSATVHDPPNLIWWPWRTRFMANHRLVNHGVHVPLQAVSRRVERSVAAGLQLFSLTDSGARSLASAYPRARVARVPHIAPVRRAVTPAPQRPLAVGFFGLVYRGKGFELIGRIRELLSDDVAIRVAGRGTEQLPSVPGIDIVGGVEGADEDAFFESVRAVVVPYGRRTFYGPAYPSSAVVTHAIGYGTPVICSDHGALVDLDQRHGAVVVRVPSTDSTGGVEQFCWAIDYLVKDSERLHQLGANAILERDRRSPQRVAQAYAEHWSRMVGTR